MPVYLDANGNPIPSAPAPQAKVYLDDQGNPTGAPNFSSSNEKDAQGNAVVRSVEGAWNWLNTPLVPQIADAAHAISGHLDYPALDRSQTEAQIRGFLAGATDAAGHLAAGFTSPIGLALTLAGVGPDTAVARNIPALKALLDLPEVQTLQHAVKSTAGTAFAAEGADKAMTGQSTAERLGGAAELATGGLGAATEVVPSLAKWSANRKATQLGTDYIQSTRDIQAALGANAEDVHRARPFLEAVHNNGIPIVGKTDAAQQFVKAADVAVNEIEQHVAGLVGQFPDATVRPMQGPIIKRVLSMPGASSADVSAARKVISEYGLDQPRTLAEAESLRVRLNAENRSVLEGSGVKQRTAVLTNPTFVARQEAANQLRDGIYSALEDRGVEGVRDLRKSEGAILKLRNAADPITRGLRSESTVARTGVTSLSRRIAQKAAQLGGASAGAALGGPVGAAVGTEIGDTLTAGLTAKNMSKNELLERAFRQSFTSPPVMSVQQIWTPNSTASGPLPLGPMASHGALPRAALPPGE